MGSIAACWNALKHGIIRGIFSNTFACTNFICYRVISVVLSLEKNSYVFCIVSVKIAFLLTVYVFGRSFLHSVASSKELTH